MFFTIADLQQRMPVAPDSYDGRTCAHRSFSIHDDIPDGAVFTSIVSIAQQWEGNRVVAFIYRGDNGHFFFDRVTPMWTSSGDIHRIERGIEADTIMGCVPAPPRTRAR
jgi:hypothetical protein